MTNNDNQKLDLLIKMFEQQSKAIEKIEETRKEDKKEWQKVREEDKKEWQKVREEDKKEWQKAREEDKKEWQRAREEDKAENARRFDQIEEARKQDKKEIIDLINKVEENLSGLIRDEKRERKESEAKMQVKLDKVYETRHEIKCKIDREFILKNLGWNSIIIVFGLILGKLMF